MNFQALKPAMYRSDRTGKRLDTKEIERQIGGDIPDALHRLLKEYDGPVIFREAAGIRPLNVPKVISGEIVEVELIYGLNDGEYGLARVNETYSGRVGEEYVPFADPGAGDQIFYSVISGQVCFWHHECSFGEGAEEAMTLIADSVAVFFENLEHIPESEDDGISSGIIETPGQFDKLRELMEMKRRGEKLPWE